MYAARVSRGSSSYRPISAAGRPQQQTHRSPLLLLIDGTDGRLDRRTLDRFMTLAAYRAISKSASQNENRDA